MARTIRGCPRAQWQAEGTGESDTNPSVPQQEEQLDTTEGKVIAHYNLHINYDRSEPKDNPVAREEKEEDPLTEWEMAPDRSHVDI